MLRFLALCALLVFTVSADFSPIGYKLCPSDSDVQEVTSNMCKLELRGTRKVCIFESGTRPNIRIKFTPKKDITEVKTFVKAKIGAGSMVEFPMTDNNACSKGPKCPLKAGQVYTYEQDIAIVDHYPMNELIQVNWQLTHGNNEKAVCIIFNVEIQEKK